MEKQSKSNRKFKNLNTLSQGNIGHRKTLNQNELENLIFNLHTDNTNLFFEVLKKNIESYSDFFKLFGQHRLFLILLKNHLPDTNTKAPDNINKKATDRIYKILKTYFKEYYRLTSSNRLLRTTWDTFFKKWLRQVDAENMSPQKMLRLSDDIMKDLRHSEPVIEFNYMYLIHPMLLKRSDL